MIADSQAELYAARSMVLDAARKRDRGENTTLEAACCKLYATEMVGRVADRAVQIHGGAGYISEYAVERFYRDVRLFRIYEGTSQIQQLVIARETIKAYRSEEHTSELQSLMRISYAVFCLKKKNIANKQISQIN